VTVQSEVYVYGRSTAVIAGSNAAAGCGHECSSVVFVVCCVGSGFCDELIACSEDS
jgi:hypothetical protein